MNDIGSGDRVIDPQDQAISIAGHDMTAQKTRQIASLLGAYEQSRGAAPAS